MEQEEREDELCCLRRRKNKLKIIKQAKIYRLFAELLLVRDGRVDPDIECGDVDLKFIKNVKVVKWMNGILACKELQNRLT